MALVLFEGEEGLALLDSGSVASEGVEHAL